MMTRRAAAAAVVAAGMATGGLAVAAQADLLPEDTPVVGAAGRDDRGGDDQGSDGAGSDAARTVTVLGSGDVLAHTPVTASAQRRAGGSGYDYAGSFAEVADDLGRADLSLCHLETPLSRDGTNLSVPGTKVFNVPRELADGLQESGYAGCSTGSNHMWDRGLAGVQDTEAVLREAGLGYAGPAPRQSTSGQVARYERGGLDIAHLSYSYTAFNTSGPSTDVPDDAPWVAATLWPVHGATGIAADARKMREDGADLVVVSMHWGDEYVTQPTEQQRSLARQLLGDGDVDLILGTHAHVVQPCERINGRYVFYGLGNVLSNQSPSTSTDLRPETQEGVLVEAALTKDADGRVTTRATYRPTRVNLDGHVVEPVGPDHHAESAERTSQTLTSLGEGSCPLTPMR